MAAKAKNGCLFLLLPFGRKKLFTTGDETKKGLKEEISFTRF